MSRCAPSWWSWRGRNRVSAIGRVFSQGLDETTAKAKAWRSYVPMGAKQVQAEFQVKNRRHDLRHTFITRLAKNPRVL